MPHNIDILVGRQLRLRRTILGLSQEAVGNPVGLTFQQIQKYERGVNRISAGRLYQFARILSVPVSYFFEDTEKVVTHTTLASEEKNVTENDKISSRETLEMMRAYYRITNSRIRKQIFELIKSLASEKPIE